MGIFGFLLLLSSFFISYFLARAAYRKRVLVSPNTEVKNKIIGAGWYAIFLIMFTFIFLLIIGAVESNKTKGGEADESAHIENKKNEVKFVREIGEAHEYTVIEKAARLEKANNRIESFRILSPNSKTKEDRAATVKKAAQDLHLKYNIPVVNVFLEATKASAGGGYILAIANFFSDGCQYSGADCNDVIWTISASGEQLSDQQLKIIDEWSKSRKRFVTKDGRLDEAALTKAVAKRLGIQEKDVELPFITKDKVNPFASEEQKNDELAQMKVKQKEKKAEMERIAARQKTIEQQFSPWDGSHRDLENRIKNIINDPDSFKHYKTTYIDKGDHITVFMEFGAKNGFGGMVRNKLSADYSIDGVFLRSDD